MDGYRQSRRVSGEIPRNATSNGFVAAEKSFHQDAFGGGHTAASARWPSHQPGPPRPVDYAEIFGRVANSCSIPVLDLPPASDEGFGAGLRSSALDYLEIFGGFDSCDLGLSYEEMFGGKCSANGRTMKGMGTYTHTDLVPESIFKEQNGDSIAFPLKNKSSSNGVSQKLNGDPGQINVSCHLERERPKPKAANGTVNVNVPNTLHSISESDTMKNSIPKMELNGGLSGNNLRNDKPPANLFNSIKRSENGVKVNQKTSFVQLNSAEDNLANEQYHSCSSSEHSTFDQGSSINDYSNVDKHADMNINGKTVEESNFSASASPTTSSSNRSPKNNHRDDRKHAASEDVPPCRDFHSGSNNLESTNLNSSVGDKSFPSQSTTDCLQKPSARDGKMEKSMPTTSSYMEMKSSDHLKSDQKHFNPAFTRSEDGSANCQCPEYLSNDISTSHAHSSSPDARFVRVTDINLQTEPSQVPPPSRPPPSRPPPKLAGGQEPPKVMMGTNPKAQPIERDCRPGTSNQILRGISETDRLNKTGKTDLPQYFDVEVDVSSAAAAAAMKEAMEQAQARLKIAKESMDRRKDNHKNCKEREITYTATFKEGKMDGAAQAAEMFKEEIVQAISETYISKGREFVADNQQKFAEVASDPLVKKILHDSAEEFPERLLDEGSEPAFISCVCDGNPAEWKVEEQFFELVNNEKNIKKLSEVSEQKISRKKSKASITVNEVSGEKSNKLLPELKKESKNLEVGETLELENSHIKTREATLVSEVEGLLEQENDDKVKEPLDPCRKEVSVILTASQEIHDPKEQEGTSNKSCTSNGNENGNECNEACISTGASEIKSQEKKPNYVEQTNVCQENKEINAANKNCNVEGGQMKLKPGCPFELHVNATEIEVIPISDVCTELDEDEYAVESIKATNESCSPEEMKPISEEANVAPEQNRGKSRESQDVYEHMENVNNVSVSDLVLGKEDFCLEKNEKKADVDADVSACSDIEGETKPINEKVNENKLDEVEDTSTYYGTEEEMETKEETRWQYFCEKIIRESKETLKEGERKQMEEKVDANPKYNEKVQTIAEESQEIGMDESAQECEHAANSEEGSSKPNTTQEAFQNVGNKNVVNDVLQNTSLGHSVNAVKTAGEVKESRDAEGTAEGIPEMSKNKERLQKERTDKEVEVEKERIRKLEEDKERQKKLEEEKERIRKLEEEKEREREREKDRQANHESRERTFTEARERAERAAMERATAEARQRALMEARERAEKASAEALFLAEKASREARLRAERVAVERATAEARERAVERAFAEKAAQEAKERAERPSATARDRQRKDNGVDGNAKDLWDSSQKNLNPSNHASYSSDKVGGSEGESAIRCKARLERHQRTVERAAKALAEKNMRDILAQREQAERNRLAEILDADVRRWSSGKEGNLRALLSTLQYILGPESGWQPIPLTDVITAVAVKKAYRKATLYVHPDKLQQRGASIQQKYICEKVFDLLKDAWNRFNSEER